MKESRLTERKAGFLAPTDVTVAWKTYFCHFSQGVEADRAGIRQLFAKGCLPEMNKILIAD